MTALLSSMLDFSERVILEKIKVSQKNLGLFDYFQADLVPKLIK